MAGSLLTVMENLMEVWHCEDVEAAVWELALPLGLRAIFAVGLFI